MTPHKVYEKTYRLWRSKSHMRQNDFDLLLDLFHSASETASFLAYQSFDMRGKVLEGWVNGSLHDRWVMGQPSYTPDVEAIERIQDEIHSDTLYWKQGRVLNELIRQQEQSNA